MRSISSLIYSGIWLGLCAVYHIFSILEKVCERYSSWNWSIIQVQSAQHFSEMITQQFGDPKAKNFAVALAKQNMYASLPHRTCMHLTLLSPQKLIYWWCVEIYWWHRYSIGRNRIILKKQIISVPRKRTTFQKGRYDVELEWNQWCRLPGIYEEIRDVE